MEWCLSVNNAARPKEHSCTEARSSCAGHHQCDDKGMFNFSLLLPVMAVASDHLGCPFEGQMDQIPLHQ